MAVYIIRLNSVFNQSSDQPCRSVTDTPRMKREPYILPAGTKCDIRNLTTGAKIVGYITKRELRFDAPVNSGWFGDYPVLYFQEGDWLISVVERNIG